MYFQQFVILVIRSLPGFESFTVREFRSPLFSWPFEIERFRILSSTLYTSPTIQSHSHFVKLTVQQVEILSTQAPQPASHIWT